MAKMPTKMPAHLRRAHPKGAEWHGDTLEAIDRAAKAGEPSVDQNCQYCFAQPKRRKVNAAGNNRVLHWGKPGLDNYHFYLEPGAKHARPMTPKERRRGLPGGWSDDEVARWRRTPDPDSAKPELLATHMKRAVAHGIPIVPELKSRAYARKVVAATVAADAEATGHPKWAMALWTMWGIKRKTAATVGAGLEFAIIFGRKKPLRAIARVAIRTWTVKPTRIW